MKLTKATFGVIVASSFGFVLFGYDGGVIAGMLTNKYFLETFNYPNDTLQGQISALFDLGCFFGAIVTFVYGNKYGRRTVIVVGSIIHVIGGVLQCSAFSTAQMIVGRLVAGFGNGFITVMIPIWLAETTQAESRGGLMGLVMVFNILGIVFVNYLNYGMRFIESHFSWRFPLSFQVILSGGCAILTPLFVESPRWLVLKGRNEQAKKSMAAILGKDLNDPEVESMYYEVVIHVEEEQAIANERKIKDLFRRDKLHNLRRITLGALSQLFQQFGGCNVILYYMPSLFQNSLGLSENLSLILAAVNFTIELCVATLCTFFVMDRMKRKTMMIYGCIGTGISMFLVGIGVGVGTDAGTKVAIVFMFVYYVVFGSSWVFSAWIYPPEINSQQYRHVGAGVSTATNWICNYVVVLITPIGIANIKWKYYMIYGATNFSFVPIIYFFFEETLGLTLEQVDELFLRKNGEAPQPVELPKDKPEHVEDITEVKEAKEV